MTAAVVSASLLLALSRPAWAARPAKDDAVVVASSARLGGYAVAFPSEVGRWLTAFEAHKAELAEIIARLGADRDALMDPRALAIVPELIEAADSSGKSYAYVERARQAEGVSNFLDAEGGEVANRIAVANQATAKEASCEVNLSRSTATAVRSSVARQLDERIREVNEAIFLIERHRIPLTRADVQALSKLADDVARASYLANVRIADDAVLLRRLAAEAEMVKRTANGVVSAETTLQADTSRTDPEKAASAARMDAATRSSGEVDERVATVRDLDADPGLHVQVATARFEYTAALKALVP